MINEITIKLPIKPGEKRYLLAKTRMQEPFRISKTDPLGFGTLVLACLTGKRPYSHHRRDCELKKYKDTLTIVISTSTAMRAGVNLTNEKVKDINDHLHKLMLLDFSSFMFGAKQFHALAVERYALEDYRDFMGIGEDDYNFDSFLKELSRKKRQYRPQL